MADDGRRTSSRATKGQHHKKDDILDQSPELPKKRGGKKSKKVGAEIEGEAETEIIRCICGATETVENDEEPWIACDLCSSWQHNVCMGISTFSEDIPDEYSCEQCAPENHQELLGSIARGERIWEDRRRQYEQEQDTRKKRGKKKGKRPSDQADASHANGTVTTSTPAPDLKKVDLGRAGSMKRKSRDESQEKEAKEPQSKIRKVSTIHMLSRPESPAQSLPVKITDLEHSRQGVANLFYKAFFAAIPEAISNGIYTLRKGESVKSKAEVLAIEVENGVYTTHLDKATYGKQCRTISANLKQNHELCSGLLTRSLTPSALAVMSTDDMASKELKKETAEMKARADKQSIMVSDDGPRIRRTHKGEEIVEGDNFTVASDSTMSKAGRRSILDPNANMAIRSPENSPGEDAAVDSPNDIEDHRSKDDIRSHAVVKQPLSVDTDVPGPERKASGQDFDINKVFNKTPTSALNVHRQSTINNSPPADGPGVDPEIDKLLQDDGMESPPYSPADYSDDPGVVWKGSVIMDPIAKFSANAKHIAGADLSSSQTWPSMLQKDLKLAGRIDPEKANDYLCSLRYSPNTDLAVLNIYPTDSDSSGFQDLFTYFTSKGRYGVLANKSAGNVRDTYLVPIPAYPAQLPDFINDLDGHKLPIGETRMEPMILVALVVRSQSPNQTPSAFRAPGENSPSIASHHQRQMSLSGNRPAMSPTHIQYPIQQPQYTPPQHQHVAYAQQQGFPTYSQQRYTDTQPYAPSPPQSRPLYPNTQSLTQQDLAQQQGEQVAFQVLGDLRDAPTLQFLLPQAFQMSAHEWVVIKEILESDEKARIDLQHLSSSIEKKGLERQGRGVQ